MTKADFGPSETPLVRNDIIDIAGLKILAFNICRGKRKTKAEALFAFFEPAKTHCYGKKFLKHDNPVMKQFVYDVILYSDIMPRRLYKFYETQLEPSTFRLQTSIQSLPQDKTWQFDYLEDIEAKYDGALLEIYEEQILTLLFDLGATVTNDQHFYSLTVPGLLSWNDTELGWLFDMNKVRQYFVK